MPLAYSLVPEPSIHPEPGRDDVAVDGYERISTAAAAVVTHAGCTFPAGAPPDALYRFGGRHCSSGGEEG